MTWSMRVHAKDQITDVIEEINTDLGEFVQTAGQVGVVKVALSDMNDKHARGVFYYWEGDTPTAVAKTTEWAVADFATDSDYDDTYENVLDFLNGRLDKDGETLSKEQAAGARVAFTNRNDGDAHLVVFYPVG